MASTLDLALWTLVSTTTVTPVTGFNVLVKLELRNARTIPEWILDIVLGTDAVVVPENDLANGTYAVRLVHANLRKHDRLVKSDSYIFDAVVLTPWCPHADVVSTP